jgi:hypothetical protein
MGKSIFVSGCPFLFIKLSYIIFETAMPLAYLEMLFELAFFDVAVVGWMGVAFISA